jgi:hypothetical protein
MCSGDDIYYVQFFHDAIESEWSAEYKLVPDEQADIESAIKSLVCIDDIIWHLLISMLQECMLDQRAVLQARRK